MTTQGIVTSAAQGFMGFDTAEPLTTPRAQAYASKGFRFCVRYVSRDDASRQRNQDKGLADLSMEDANSILASGMSLMVVQHVAAAGWSLSASLGQAYGENAARYTSMAGIPKGVNLWLDLGDTPTDVTIAYCNAWYTAVAASGYEPGIYVGVDTYLTSDELFFDLKFKHYWRSGSRDVPDISHRGYQLFQKISNPNTNQELDSDVKKYDAFGCSVKWLTPQ